MTVMEKRPELDVHSGLETQLRVERTDISFQDVDGERVRIQVRVSNPGWKRSQPTTMRLESAPLGAFVPWQPLSVLPVPALEPGESRELSTVVSRPRPAPLGDFGGIPPKRLLTALNDSDEPPQQRGTALRGMLGLLRRQGATSPGTGGVANRKGSLAPDLWDSVGRRQAHWAGNINVFVGACPVERHLARALRIYPGRPNLAMFVVGGPGRRDAYSFELLGLPLEWQTALHDVTHHRSLLVDPSSPAIQQTVWVESTGSLMVMLATHPPAECQTGNLEVHVTRRSCGTTAVVEFDLNPNAQGTGCYFL
jgi:hypothetical protein